MMPDRQHTWLECAGWSPIPNDAKTGSFAVRPDLSLLLFMKIEASMWLKSVLLCLVVGFYFEEKGGNFRSSKVKMRSKPWQLFKTNEKPPNEGLSVTLETSFKKAR